MQRRAPPQVVALLIRSVRDGRDVNLNALKMDVARRHGLARAPKLVEIIAAGGCRALSALLQRFEPPLQRSDPISEGPGSLKILEAIRMVLVWALSLDP